MRCNTRTEYIHFFTKAISQTNKQAPKKTYSFFFFYHTSGKYISRYSIFFELFNENINVYIKEKLNIFKANKKNIKE